MGEVVGRVRLIDGGWGDRKGAGGEEMGGKGRGGKIMGRKMRAGVSCACSGGSKKEGLRGEEGKKVRKNLTTLLREEENYDRSSVEIADILNLQNRRKRTK